MSAPNTVLNLLASKLSDAERESLVVFMDRHPLLSAKAGLLDLDIAELTGAELNVRLKTTVETVLDEAPAEHVFMWAEAMLMSAADNCSDDGDENGC